MRYLCVFIPLAFTGCPLDAGGAGSNAPAGGAGAAGDAATFSADLAAAGGSAAIEQLIDQATRDRFPPPPPLSTLCDLHADQTSFDQAKQLLAKPNEQAKYPGAPPESESQDKSMAGLAYRFSGPPTSGAKSDPGAQAASAISLILRFSWSDGDVGLGTKIFGFGGSKEDLLKGYILKEMSLTGQPYPSCWPHEEE
jgi:hypothetical protein